MIISLATRHAASAIRPGEPHAGWRAALARLRDAATRGELPAPETLPALLEGVAESDRAEARLDVAAVHLALAWQRGPGARVEAYVRALGLPPEDAAALAEDELLARSSLPHGDLPGPAEYPALAGRFAGGGRFVKVRRVGAGGMGEVWEGVDRRERRAVAVKLPRAGLTPAELRAFAREGEVLGRLQHGGIPALVAAGEEGGVPYLVAGFAAGRSMAALVAEAHRAAEEQGARAARPAIARLLAAFLDACDAVSHAHGRGVVHGDLKPGNIVVRDGASAAVLDWGLAREGEGAFGTPESMAPEQAEGRADVRSDVFGLGAVLHEVLAGCPPRDWPDGVRPAGWLDAVRQPLRLDALRSCGASRPLRDACAGALAHDPARRPASAEALAAAVREAAGRGGGGLGGLLARAWGAVGRRL